MHHSPKRVRTAQAGACSYCVKRKERCYIGVKGIPCTTFDRLNLNCDGRTNVPKTSRSQAKRRTPSLKHCEEELFASQLQIAEREQTFRCAAPDIVPTTYPLDNYLSIIDQFLGPQHNPAQQVTSTPDYVTKLPDRLGADDVAYIEAKGALCLPAARFRTELLKSYILWVHPEVPVLDLEMFLRAIADNNGVNPISLLLFHAAMFAGAAFVDMNHIHQEGYTTREAARDILFQRVKVLLEVECEDDRLATVQALLLLVHWQDVQSTQKDASHLIGIALSLAVSIGLHRSPDSTSMYLRQRRVWKRTWWSLYNHARLTSEDLLTMMTIEGDHHVGTAPGLGMITLCDFEFKILAPEVRAVVDDCEVLRSLEQADSRLSIRSILFDKTSMKNGRRLVLCFLIQLFQQFTGINVIAFYVTIVLEANVGLTREMSSLVASFIQIAFWAGRFPPMLLMDRLGRRKVLMYGSTMLGIMMVLFTVAIALTTPAWSRLALAMLVIYEFSFGMSWNSVPWLYAPEITPENLRHVGAAVGCFSEWLWTFVIAYMTPAAIENTGWKIYLLFCIMIALSIPFVYFFLPETSGKTLEEIDYIFVKSTATENAQSATSRSSVDGALKTDGRDGQVEHV